MAGWRDGRMEGWREGRMDGGGQYPRGARDLKSRTLVRDLKKEIPGIMFKIAFFRVLEDFEEFQLDWSCSMGSL